MKQKMKILQWIFMIYSIVIPVITSYSNSSYFTSKWVELERKRGLYLVKGKGMTLEKMNPVWLCNFPFIKEIIQNKRISRER